MPDVTLLDYTGSKARDPWHAVNVLLFTKNTRLNMDPESFAAIEAMDPEAKITELRLMAKTIPSSWEFVDLTFIISGVTRACAQQITRTRNASYSMQSQRIVDLTDAEVTNPFPEGTEAFKTFEQYQDLVMGGYMRLLALGANAQDARGILPMNTQCNLLAKYNLRSFVELVKSRSSLRTQSEYATIVYQMVTEAKAVWPWIEIFLEHPLSVAIEELESVAQELGVVPGSGAGWRVAKAIDLLRR